MLKEKSASLEQTVSNLRGVGPKLKERLNKLGIDTLEDLLMHLPMRYEDRTTLSPINRIRLEQRAVVDGVIASANIEFGRRRSLNVTIEDKTGILKLRFFYF